MCAATANNLFLCYRREDSADITGRFYDRLVAHFGKGAVFKDVDSIPLGVDFRSHIDATIRQCAVVIVIIGDRWLEVVDAAGRPRLQSEFDHVRIEIQSALRREIPIVPLLVREARQPEPEHLPEPIRELAFRNGASLRSDPHFHADASFVIDRLDSILQPSAPATEPPPVETPAPQPAPVPTVEKPSAPAAPAPTTQPLPSSLSQPATPPAGEKKSPVAAPIPVTPRPLPGDESTTFKVFKVIFTVVLTVTIIFAIIGSVFRIIGLLGSAASGHFGPEHIFLLVVIVAAIAWVVKKFRK
jgi:hypothetical protein